MGYAGPSLLLWPLLARLLLHLPPSVLLGKLHAEEPAMPSCEEFFYLVNSELVGAVQVAVGLGRTPPGLNVGWGKEAQGGHA